MTTTKITKRSLVGYTSDVFDELMSIKKRLNIKEFDTLFRTPGRRLLTDCKTTIVSLIEGKKTVHNFKKADTYKLQTNEVALMLHQLGDKTYLTLVDTYQ